MGGTFDATLGHWNGVHIASFESSTAHHFYDQSPLVAPKTLCPLTISFRLESRSRPGNFNRFQEALDLFSVLGRLARFEHRTEAIPPEPYCLVADVDAPLEQNILELSQRQRIADVHHHREPDHLRRTVEIAEGIAHRRRLRILARRLKPI